MAKQSKSGNRNDARSNGKAEKKNPGRKNVGSKPTKLNDLQKILMGKGLMVTYARHDASEARTMAGKRNKAKNQDA